MLPKLGKFNDFPDFEDQDGKFPNEFHPPPNDDQLMLFFKCVRRSSHHESTHCQEKIWDFAAATANCCLPNYDCGVMGAVNAYSNHSNRKRRCTASECHLRLSALPVIPLHIFTLPWRRHSFIGAIHIFSAVVLWFLWHIVQYIQ